MDRCLGKPLGLDYVCCKKECVPRPGRRVLRNASEHSHFIGLKCFYCHTIGSFYFTPTVPRPNSCSSKQHTSFVADLLIENFKWFRHLPNGFPLTPEQARANVCAHEQFASANPDRDFSDLGIMFWRLNETHPLLPASSVPAPSSAPLAPEDSTGSSDYDSDEEDGFIDHENSYWLYGD